MVRMILDLVVVMMPLVHNPYASAFKKAKIPDLLHSLPRRIVSRSPFPSLSSLYPSTDISLSCIVTSAIRVHYSRILASYSTIDDHFYEIIDWHEMWSKTEANASVFTACLPTLGPFFTGNVRSSVQTLLRFIRSRLSLRKDSTLSDMGFESDNLEGQSSKASSIQNVEDVGRTPGTRFTSSVNYGGKNAERNGGDRAIVVEKSESLE